MKTYGILTVPFFFFDFFVGARLEITAESRHIPKDSSIPVRSRRRKNSSDFELFVGVLNVPDILVLIWYHATDYTVFGRVEERTNILHGVHLELYFVVKHKKSNM